MRWITFSTETNQIAEGQRPLPSRKQAIESAERVNAFRVAIGFTPCIAIRPF